MSICSGDIVDLKIRQSDWLGAFWPTYQESGIKNMRSVQEPSK